MHYQLRQAPFIRLVPPLIAGILFQHNIALAGWIIYLLLASFLLSVILIKISGLASHFVWTRSFGFAVNICFFLFGMGLVKEIEPEPLEPAVRIGTISKIPESYGGSYRVILERIHERSGRHWKKIEGKGLVYLNVSIDSTSLRPGNKILFYSRLDTISGPKNPMAFDARRFYNNRKIYWNVSISDNQFRIIQSTDLRLTIMAELCRLKLIGILNDQDIRHAGILTALLTGYRQGLDENEKQYFTDSGAMHIMAVSGLHTGIIYGMLSLLFSMFFRKHRNLKLLLPVPFIWIFALVTGLSPSVCRAALMISLIAAAACLKRQKNYNNVLFFTAFLLIVINPGIIFEVSFQLSFTAVFGIVSCFIPAYRKIRTGRYIPDRIIGLLLISVFAQLFTFPLSAYYFHQFPHYFLLTNLLVIPLIPLILYSGAAFLSLQWIPSMASVAGEILNFLNEILFKTVQFISSFPFSVTQDIYFRPVEVVILYACIISVMIWLKHRLTGFLFSGLMAIILLIGIDLHDQLNQHNQRLFLVYHNRGSLLCDFVIGKKHISLSNGSNQVEYDQNKTYHLSLGLREHQHFNLNEPDDFQSKDICLRRTNALKGLAIINYQSTQIGILSSWPGNTQAARCSLDLDILILQDPGDFELEKVLDCLCPQIIVIDRNVSFRHSNIWKQVCQAKNIPVHSVYEGGYFIKDL